MRCCQVAADKTDPPTTRGRSMTTSEGSWKLISIITLLMAREACNESLGSHQQVQLHCALTLTANEHFFGVSR